MKTSGKLQARFLNLSKAGSRFHTSVVPVSSKASNQDIKDMDVFCTFKINIESQNLENVCIKDQWLYPIQDQDAKPQWGTSSVLQSPKWGLEGHGCSLLLQNQDRDPKFRALLYQNPVTISKSRSKCQTQVRILQHTPKPKIGTWRTWMFFHLQS